MPPRLPIAPAPPLYYPTPPPAADVQQYQGGLNLDVTQLTGFPEDPAVFLDGEGNFTTPDGGTTIARTTPTGITTASLIDGAVENGTWNPGCKAGQLLSITVDRSCRVELYCTSAARTADATRLLGTQAVAGIGLLAEFFFTAAGTVNVSPAAFLHNEDGTPATTIYYAITNRSGSTSTVAVTMTVLPLEV